MYIRLIIVLVDRHFNRKASISICVTSLVFKTVKLGPDSLYIIWTFISSNLKKQPFFILLTPHLMRRHFLVTLGRQISKYDPGHNIQFFTSTEIDFHEYTTVLTTLTMGIYNNLRRKIEMIRRLSPIRHRGGYRPKTYSVLIFFVFFSGICYLTIRTGVAVRQFENGYSQGKSR